MSEQPFKNEEVAIRVSEISLENRVSSSENQTKILKRSPNHLYLKAVHLPSVHLPWKLNKKKIALHEKAPFLEKIPQRERRIRNFQKISTQDLLNSETLITNSPHLYAAAIGANQCCLSRDLHLLNLKKIYAETKRPMKKAFGWRLPKFCLTSSAMEHSINDFKQIPNRRFFKPLAFSLEKAKSENELKTSVIEMEKAGKERRNYPQSKPTFF